MMFERVLDQPPERRQLRGIVEVFLLGNPESPEAEDLPERTRQNMTRCPVPKDGGQPRSHNSVLVSNRFKPRRAIENLHRRPVEFA